MKTDQQIQDDVLEELRWEPSLDATQIGVAARSGIVTLTGGVCSYVEKLSAERVAKRVGGVRAVANEIEVRIRGIHKRDDTDIATAAVNALRWDTSVPSEQIKVSVRNGWVTLEGNVDWYFQKIAAYDAIKKLAGVRGIYDHITILPSAKATDVKKQIKAALHRCVEQDANQISVDSKGGTVTLLGRVRSFLEREEAETAAWRAPGVLEVQNKIEVQY